jgi:predicted kinase
VKQNLIILAGVPGSGKTTYAKALFTEPYANNHIWVSSDHIRELEFGSLTAAHTPEVKRENNAKVFGIFHDRINKHLDDGWNVVADATFLTRSSRNKVKEIADRYQAETHLILFKNVTQAEQRNSKRNADKFVPDEAMSRMFDNYYNSLAEITQETYNTVTKIESFA